MAKRIQDFRKFNSSNDLEDKLASNKAKQIKKAKITKGSASKNIKPKTVRADVTSAQKSKKTQPNIKDNHVSSKSYKNNEAPKDSNKSVLIFFIILVIIGTGIRLFIFANI